MKHIEKALDVVEKAISGINTPDAKIMFHIGNARVELEQLKKGNRIAYPPDFMSDKEKDAVLNKKINDLDMLLSSAVDKYEEKNKELAQLKENLRGIEFVDNCPSDRRFKFCPACDCNDDGHPDAHDPDCWLKRAIGGD